MRRTRHSLVALVVCALCTSLGPAYASASTNDHGVRLNQIQVVGTHNSYHVEASPREKALREAFDPVHEPALEYGHVPLVDQFTSQSIRQIELDVFADPKGGLYANPLIRAVTGGGPYDPVMKSPGIKVLHMKDVDYRSNCLTLDSCLHEVKAWSDANPSHVPISVLIQLEDNPIAIPNLPIPLVQPVKWDTQQMDALDAQIEAVFPTHQVITPDKVRGHEKTLEKAVLENGWPTLKQSRGKVMFLMDNAGAYRTTYLAGHPDLRGRQLFTNSTPGQPDAAFVEENDPLGANLARIQDEVHKGYIVRTRADVDTVQARTGDTTMRDAALASGAQMVSTDYPVPGIASRFGTSYVAQLPDGLVSRCNPINAPQRCSNTVLSKSRP